MAGEIILDLCGGTGAWSEPYKRNGYTVFVIDLKSSYYTDGEYTVNIPGLSVRTLRPPLKVHGILAAPPCTDFTSSGAQYWPIKDMDGRTTASLLIVHSCLDLIDVLKPDWWSLENPIGRLPKLCPRLGKYKTTFDPCDYGGYLTPPGDAYTKRTCLWGNFNMPAPRRVEPEKVCSEGSWLMKLGGKSDRTKTLRSTTPQGFAQAFYEANP
jgi:hypothetical protein